jgi:hypothetical protein
MPFENSSEQYRPREAQQTAQHLTLLPSAAEYHTFGANALVQRAQASNELVGSGVLTPLKFNSNSQETPVLIAQGPAEQTGMVTDYPTNKVGDQYTSGMNWQQSADTRAASEKLRDFLGALGKNGINPENGKQYIQDQLDKLIGVGEGLHISKEQTKGTAAAGWKALHDGTVAEFLSKPNAVNEPMFKVVSTALDALSKDPESANKALAALGTAIAESSEHYSALPNREKGHVIGQAMFNLFNPEGNTEAADAGLKIANTVTAHVDQVVVQAVGQQIRAIEEMAKTAPEHAQQAKQMLFEYLKGKGLTGSQLEYAGVPKGYFDESGVKLKGSEVARPSERPLGDNVMEMTKYFEYGNKRPISAAQAAEKAGVSKKELGQMTEEELEKHGLESIQKRYDLLFYDKHPHLRPFKSEMQVHHAFPQELLDRCPWLFKAKEINDVRYMSAIPNDAMIQGKRVHQRITNSWSEFLEEHNHPTRAQVLEHLRKLDEEYGQYFVPPVKKGER